MPEMWRHGDSAGGLEARKPSPLHAQWASFISDKFSRFFDKYPIPVILLIYESDARQKLVLYPDFAHAAEGAVISYK